MKLQTYLKFNGIKLIDPENAFHIELIKFYNTRKYLTCKQIQALRNYCYSIEDIVRLTAKPKKPSKKKTTKKIPKTTTIDDDDYDLPF